MKFRPVLVGLVAAVLGAVLFFLYMRRFELEVSGGRKIELLVANAPIERGKPITDSMLGIREVPQAYVDDRAVRATDREKVLGLPAATNIPVQQTLSWTDLIATADERRDLSSLVQPGNRAMPIRVQLDDVLPLIRPGDFVDVIAVYGATKEATVLLQRVLVLAAGLETSNERADKRPMNRATILTLSVTLPESQLLALAATESKLTVAVRNPDDQRIAEAPADLSVATLIDSAKRQVVQNSRKRQPTGPVRLEVDKQK
jgi:pilus assembly protein CpaB